MSDHTKYRNQGVCFPSQNTLRSSCTLHRPTLVNRHSIQGAAALDVSSAISALTESSPLLARAQSYRVFTQTAQTDPQGFVLSYVKKPVLWALGPVLAALPTIEEDVDNRTDPLKAFYLEICILLKYSIPTFLAYLQEHSIVLAPIISIGHLSTLPLAATTVATMISNVTGYGVISGFTSALDHVLDPEAPSSLYPGFWCLCTSFILLLTLMPIASLWSSMDGVLLSLRQTPDMVQLTTLYLHLSAIGIPGFAVNEVLKRYLASQGQSSIHTRLTAVAASLNVTLNYVLVHGPSYLQLGLAGAPTATAMCYSFVAISSALYIALSPRVSQVEAEVRVEDEGDKAPRPSFAFGLGIILYLGVGGIARTAAAFWSKDVLGFSCSILGPIPLATQAVLMATASTAYQASRAIGECSQRRISQLLKDRNIQRAKIAMTATTIITVAILLVICNILFLYCDSWSTIFTNDLAVGEAVKTLLPLISLYIVAQGLGACVDHFLRVFNKPAVYPGLTLSADYFGGIPFGLWLIFREGWGLIGLWVGLTASLMCSFAIALIILVRCEWSSS